MLDLHGVLVLVEDKVAEFSEVRLGLSLWGRVERHNSTSLSVCLELAH
jgi:hypothetical protein